MLRRHCCIMSKGIDKLWHRQSCISYSIPKKTNTDASVKVADQGNQVQYTVERIRPSVEPYRPLRPQKYKIRRNRVIAIEATRSRESTIANTLHDPIKTKSAISRNEPKSLTRNQESTVTHGHEEVLSADCVSLESETVISKTANTSLPSLERTNNSLSSLGAPVKESDPKDLEEESSEDTKKPESLASETEERVDTEQEISLDDVCVVDTVLEARRVMDVLQKIIDANPKQVFACDTEVKDIDVLKESPKGHGKVICFSIYCGEDVNFAKHPSTDHQTHLWIDTMGEDAEVQSEEAQEIMTIFKAFFEDERFKKVWHNYGFDRHVMANMAVDCRGFCGDTMHMARLWDSSRKGKGYTLESLSNDRQYNVSGVKSQKTSMKDLFGRPKIKADGSLGKLVIVPPVEELQTDQNSRKKWIHYSARDAKATYDLYHVLRTKLSDNNRALCVMDSMVKECYPEIRTQWDFYTQVWLPFGELLTDMEDFGFLVDTQHLAKAQIQAEADKEGAKQRFLSWAMSRVKGGEYINPSSVNQIRTLLFAGIRNRSTKKEVEYTRKTEVDNPEYKKHIEEGRPGRKPKKHVQVYVHSMWEEEKGCPLKPEVFTASGWPAVSSIGLRSLIGKPGAARELLEKRYGVSIGSDISDLAAADDGDETTDELKATEDEAAYCRTLDAVENGLGSLYSAFEDPKEGLQACVAVEALLEISAIETLLSSFILPLQEDNIKTKDGRIHCSMNINTETGRLSCRRPNLQNQPALEKDRYRVRQSFQAGEGNTLIVADYGQLELRILAHLSQCKSMLEAFESGGDFHSRTAMGMYDYIQKEVDAGNVALEMGTNGDERPLVKDVYASERRRAKVLNFSIAYGKTAHGLAKDWKVDMIEAEDTLNRWYADREEVREWQRTTIVGARKTGYVTTLLGRRRRLREINSTRRHLRSHAERASINTPIQGSAADIATAAMLAIKRNQRLAELGWELLSQVHDEMILEGPEEAVAEAQSLIVDCMQYPFPSPNGIDYCNPLSVDLAVEANYAKNWYEAK